MTDMRQAIEPLEDREGPKSKLLEISNMIVGLHKQFYGRGPTKARATLARDVLVIVLEGGYSQAERTLVESGRTDTVRDGRHALQAVIKEHWIAAVEALLGRRVRSFLSANDPVQQIQVETFVFEPEDSPDRSSLVHAVDSSDGHSPTGNSSDGHSPTGNSSDGHSPTGD